MAIDVRWYDTGKHIILWDFPATFTTEEFLQAAETSFALAKAENRPHGVVIDMSRNTELPRGILTHVRQIQSRAANDPNYRITVSIGVGGSNAIAKTFVETLRRTGFDRIFGNVRFADNLPTALDIIQQKLGLSSLNPIKSGHDKP